MSRRRREALWRCVELLCLALLSAVLVAGLCVAGAQMLRWWSSL